MEKILILGGSRFVGRHIVETLKKSSSAKLYLYNRGQSNPDLFSNTELIKGDRLHDDFKSLAEHNWDGIIDVSGYWPGPLQKMLQKLKGKIGRYVYISTCSHYDFSKIDYAPIREDAPLIDCSEEEAADLATATYNQRKAECERVIQKESWLEAVILRPGLIIGQHDYTDRLYYWFHRVAHYDSLIVPNGGVNRLSYSDVTDLAKMAVKALDINSHHSVFNATSYTASIGDMLKGAMLHLKKEPKLVHADADFLAEQKVSQWLQMPLWLESDFLTTDNQRIQEVFPFSPKKVEETIKDLIHFYGIEMAWHESKNKAAISRERELELMGLLENQA